MKLSRVNIDVVRSTSAHCRTRRGFLGKMALLALTVTLLAGCSGAPTAPDAGSAPASEQDTSASATGTLVVGFDQAYPPYGFVGDDGEYTGFDLELAAAVAEKQGWEVRFEPIDWDAKDALLDSGVINCIWNGFTMEGREDDYTFSKPYMLNAQVVMMRADDAVASLDDLAGKTVVTQVDSAAEAILGGDRAELASTFGSLETIGEYNTAFMQLESGAVDAVACDLSIAQYQMAANPGAYVMVEEQLSRENYAVGFKKGDTATAEAVTASLVELDEEGVVEELCASYADMGLSYENWQLR